MRWILMLVAVSFILFGLFISEYGSDTPTALVPAGTEVLGVENHKQGSIPFERGMRGITGSTVVLQSP